MLQSKEKSSSFPHFKVFGRGQVLSSWCVIKAPVIPPCMIRVEAISADTGVEVCMTWTGIIGAGVNGPLIKLLCW